MPNKKKSPIILTLDGPRRLEARVSVRRLADGLVMSADGGFGAGMAVTMIRNAAQQVGHDITLSVTATRDDQTGRQAVRAEMRQAVTVLGTLLKYLGGFLQMAG